MGGVIRICPIPVIKPHIRWCERSGPWGSSDLIYQPCVFKFVVYTKNKIIFFKLIWSEENKYENNIVHNISLETPYGC